MVSDGRLVEMLIVLEDCKTHNIKPEFRCWEEDDVLHGFYVCPKCAEEDKTVVYYKTWKELLEKREQHNKYK